MEKVRQKINSIKEKLKAIKRPTLPKCPDFSRFVPSLPSLPNIPSIKIPLPNALESALQKLHGYDSLASPVFRPMNYLILILSILCMFQ
jgi:hypothetical protein